MRLYEKVINWIYNVLLIGVVVGCIIASSVFMYNKLNDWKSQFENQEEQLEELYNNQITLNNTLTKLANIQLLFIKLVNEELIELNKKPSYEYLQSVSVYVFQTDDITDDEAKGGVGSGTIVAERDGYYYILTNKHVCDIFDEGTCYVVQDQENGQLHELQFVKRTESQYDLSLWRIKVSELDNKQAINGINISYPQDSLYSVGSYLGNAYIYVEGTYAGYDGDFSLANLSCAPGCSGSGIFNKDGELIGVIFAVNGVPLVGIPTLASMDTSKSLFINGDVVALFLKELYE